MPTGWLWIPGIARTNNAALRSDAENHRFAHTWIEFRADPATLWKDCRFNCERFEQKW